jgi:hypothetical protein
MHFLTTSLSLNFSATTDRSPYQWRFFCSTVWCSCSGPPRRRKYYPLCQPEDQRDSRRRCSHGGSILLVHDRGQSVVPGWHSQLPGVYAVRQQSRCVLWTTRRCSWTTRPTRRGSWAPWPTGSSRPAGPSWNGHGSAWSSWNGHGSARCTGTTRRLCTSAAERGA